MKFSVATILSVVCVFCVVKQLQCARILAIVPTPSYSHQTPYRPLWFELNKRGHEIVLVTTNPIPNLNLTNFTQIDVGGSYADLRRIEFITLRFQQTSWLSFLDQNLLNLCDVFTRQVFNNAEMKKMYAPNSSTKFDVVMAEMLYMPAIYAFAYRFNAPLIGLSSLGITSINEHALGGFVLPSHEYTWELEANTGSNLSFWKRLQNYVNLWRSLYYIYRDHFPHHQMLAEGYLGTRLPPMLDILKNTSLIFVNQANVMAPARPKLANMITFTSFHVDEKPKPLPKNLQSFVDSASEGFIYFSLGSNAMSSDIPKETLQVFLDVFAKLPYKVVWKFEKEWSDKPDNIYVSPWFPQQSILAHRNIKLYIYQGGLQSSEEAVHFTVPLLGLPVLADQDYQVRRMEALGVGKVLEITTIQKDELESAVREIITNRKYKENMIRLKNIVNDNPYNLVDHLAWWTEYVIRHKGAPHLRSNLAHQPWYQRSDMDIVAFLILATCLLVLIAFKIFAKIFAHFDNQECRAFPGNQKQKVS
ncbi:UDP-glucosyltransferase 2-like [Colletes latitarsis]|uniref:UDP-glucosyltransferase 2-like n=1 Tax=Colletes latitarsis TaxID=2605962 RepID=UPI0040357C64